MIMKHVQQNAEREHGSNTGSSSGQQWSITPLSLLFFLEGQNYGNSFLLLKPVFEELHHKKSLGVVLLLCCRCCDCPSSKQNFEASPRVCHLCCCSIDHFSLQEYPSPPLLLIYRSSCNGSPLIARRPISTSVADLSIISHCKKTHLPCKIQKKTSTHHLSAYFYHRAEMSSSLLSFFSTQPRDGFKLEKQLMQKSPMLFDPPPSSFPPQQHIHSFIPPC